MDAFQESRDKEIDEFNKADSTEREIHCGEVSYIGCCDCGLLHKYMVEIIGENRIKVRLIRDDNLTDQARQKFPNNFLLLRKQEEIDE